MDFLSPLTTDVLGIVAGWGPGLMAFIGNGCCYCFPQDADGSCPDKALIKRYAQDQLGTDGRNRIERHLGTCEACASRPMF